MSHGLSKNLERKNVFRYYGLHNLDSVNLRLGVSISFPKAKKISVKLAEKNASPANRLSLKTQIYHSPALQDSVNSSYCEKKN